MILHLLHADGGFLCGDTSIGLAAYAYPTSPAADMARRKPEKAARWMLESADMQLACVATHPDMIARNERWLAELLVGTPEGRAAKARVDALIDAGIAAQDRGYFGEKV